MTLKKIYNLIVPEKWAIDSISVISLNGRTIIIIQWIIERT